MRLLCHFEGTQYIACGEILVSFDHATSGDVRQFEFEHGKSSQIIAVAISIDGKFVYAAYSNKFICCWVVLTGKVLGSIQHSKRPTAIVYVATSPTRTALIVSDKAGLIWGMDVPLFQKQVLLAGHTASVITDMATDGKYVATADRDEKIRISNFPRMDMIQSFCMEHTNVVTSTTFIKLQENSLLLSCGWDHRLCLWNHMTGEIIDTVQYELPHRDVCKIVLSLNHEILRGEDSVIPNNSTVFEPSTEVATEFDIEKDTPEDVAEKTYDENIAGSYPVKVVTSLNSAIVAVIFKNDKCVKLYNINRTAIVGGYSFGGEVIKELLAVPCDVCFTNSDDLIVLLPKPFFLQIFTLSLLNGGSHNLTTAAIPIIEINEFNDKSLIVSAFQKVCIDQGFEFFQQLVSTEDGVDAEKGAYEKFSSFLILKIMS